MRCTTGFGLGNGCLFGFAGLLAIFLLTPLLFGQDRAAWTADSPPDTSVRRFEIGGQTSYVGLFGCEWGQKDCDHFGKGAGIALNLNRHFALDSSFVTMRSMPPTTVGDPSNPSAIAPVASGGISEFLAGVRIESRARRWGVFARVSPGVMNWKNRHGIWFGQRLRG